MEEYIRLVKQADAEGNESSGREENGVLMGSVFFCNTKALVVFLACNPGPHMLKSC